MGEMMRKFCGHCTASYWREQIFNGDHFWSPECKANIDVPVGLIEFCPLCDPIDELPQQVGSEMPTEKSPCKWSRSIYPQDK